MKVPLIIAAVLLSSVLATPDCYDFSVTQVKANYLEILPTLLYFNHVDWMLLDPGQNCAFYTYGDVFFKAYDADVVAIYFKFTKGSGLTCTLDATIADFKTTTWLYSNTMMAP